MQKNDWPACFLLLAGLIIVPAVFGIFGVLFGSDENTSTNFLTRCLLLAFLVVGFCCCLTSAFFTLHSLSKKFLLAFVAIGLFAVDFYISIVISTWIFWF